MSVPLNEITNFRGNIYEITNAIVKRSRQVTEIGDDDLDKHQGKPVSTAIDQIFSKKITYHLED